MGPWTCYRLSVCEGIDIGDVEVIILIIIIIIIIYLY
jgi:hypothetical protein